MANDFEDMVKLVHKFQIEGAQGQVERRREELIEAQNRLQVLRQDDSKARRLTREMMDLIARVRT